MHVYRRAQSASPRAELGPQQPVAMPSECAPADARQFMAAVQASDQLVLESRIWRITRNSESPADLYRAVNARPLSGIQPALIRIAPARRRGGPFWIDQESVANSGQTLQIGIRSNATASRLIAAVSFAGIRRLP